MEAAESAPPATEAELKCYTGACHCRSVQFEVRAPKHLVAWDCNCSICQMKRNTHFIVPRAQFSLRSGAEALTTYSFNTHTAQHKFCSVCGVQAFYIPRSNPDGVAVTLWCIDEWQAQDYEISPFDGKQWEAAYEQTGIKGFSQTHSS